MVSKVLFTHEMTARKDSVLPAPIVYDAEEILLEQFADEIPVVVADLSGASGAVGEGKRIDVVFKSATGPFPVQFRQFRRIRQHQIRHAPEPMAHERRFISECRNKTVAERGTEMPDVRFMVHFKEAFCRLLHQDIRVRAAVGVDLHFRMSSLEYRLYPERTSICRNEISLGLKSGMSLKSKPIGIS